MTVRAALLVGLWTAGVSFQTVNAAPARAKIAQTAPYQVGKAAWYGERFQGRKTSSGEFFDMHKLTAAHLKLPLGSLVRVTNLKNNRAVVVRINDRGPWGNAGRIIDLSYAASRRLEMTRSGVVRVRLDRIGKTQSAPLSLAD